MDQPEQETGKGVESSDILDLLPQTVDAVEAVLAGGELAPAADGLVGGGAAVAGAGGEVHLAFGVLVH